MWKVIIILIAWTILIMGPCITMTSNLDIVHNYQFSDVTSEIISISQYDSTSVDCTVATVTSKLHGKKIHSDTYWCTTHMDCVNLSLFFGHTRTVSVNFMLDSNYVNVKLNWCDIIYHCSKKNRLLRYLIINVDLALEMMSQCQ